MIIYLITNLTNGKQYVGQTIQPLKRRWDFHVCKRSGCLALKAAMQKYGKDNFKIEEIYRAASLEELCEKEMGLIASLNTLAPNGYNLTTGGERPTYSDESRAKMSKSASKRSSWAKGVGMEDPRVQRRVAAGVKGLKAKYGDSSPAKGIKWSDESRKKLSKTQTGRKLSEETKSKISKSHIGIKKPEGFSEKMSNVKSHLKVQVLCEQTGIVYESINSASRIMGIPPGHISRVISKKLKHAKGFTFKRIVE